MHLRPISSKRLRLNATLACIALFVAGQIRGENVPIDHPASEVVKAYLSAVVAQDWTKASALLLPNSLERKQRETVAIIKTAPTMTEEAAMLARLGVKDVRELEKMSPQEFYIADRVAVHKKINVAPEVFERKKETLKINILGLAGEDENRVVHAVVRTVQDTLDARIEELFLISMVQDKDDSSKWLIVPDMMRPITTPLAALAADGGAGEAKEGAGAADGGSDKDAKDKKGESKSDDKK